MSSTQSRNIALVGASGTIGSKTVAALINTKLHNITAISRNYDEKAAKDAEVLGLQEEDLDEAIKTVLEELAAVTQ